MKPFAIKKEHCSRYPLEYIAASIKEHGVALGSRGGPEEYKDEDKMFWLALRANVDNDNCFAFALHNWPSIIKSDPQWSPHTTQLWDSIVDVCNGGFPGRHHHHHLQLIIEFLPSLTSVHQQAFKEHIFNTWSPSQWEEFFKCISRYDCLETMMKILEDVDTLTDQDVLEYVSDMMLSWVVNQETKLVQQFSQTTIGKKSLQHIEQNIIIALPGLLDKCRAFDETSSCVHSSVYILNEHIPLHLDETTKKCILRSFVRWLGSVPREMLHKNDTHYAQEISWIRSLWNTLPSQTHVLVYEEFNEYWPTAVRGVEKMLELDFKVDLVCKTIGEMVGEDLTVERFPNISAYLQSQRIKLELPEVEHEKLRKL